MAKIIDIAMDIYKRTKSPEYTKDEMIKNCCPVHFMKNVNMLCHSIKDITYIPLKTCKECWCRELLDNKMA